MSSEGSDIEIKSSLPKKILKKPPRSPSDDLTNNNLKKITTKLMIHDALIELKSRKGVSLYAIKKYITEKFNVNTDKINYIIKKNIKNGVEDGSIVQIKGIGASGSFKLANIKEKKIKKPKKKKESEKPKESMEKKKKVKTTGEDGGKKKPKDANPKTMEKKEEKKAVKKKIRDVKVKKIQKEKSKKDKLVDENNKGKSKSKMAKSMQTPAKKRAAMMKRKSIGSIIKPPKMKPKPNA